MVLDGGKNYKASIDCLYEHAEAIISRDSCQARELLYQKDIEEKSFENRELKTENVNLKTKVKNNRRVAIVEGIIITVSLILGFSL